MPINKSLISDEQIKATTEFHGHWCPGLAIGVRAAEAALARFDRSADEELVVVSETDMCGVDAIQFLVGASVGKGNLLFRDYGKIAFTFYSRTSGRAFRILLNPDAPGFDLENREAKSEAILNADLDRLFTTTEIPDPPPKKARRVGSIRCADCGELTMETRARRADEKLLCIPCFNKKDNRWGDA